MTDAPDEEPKIRRSRLLLAGGLAFMGVLHFAVPRAFDRIVPDWVPGAPRTWTYLSGLWELGSAVLLANRGTAKLGGYAAAATFVAVYPANVQMSVDQPPTTAAGLALAARLPLQFPMIFWALRVARRPAPTGSRAT